MPEWRTPDCGTSHFKDENIRRKLKDRLPGRDYIDGMSFGAITEYDTITLIPSLSPPIDGNLCKY